MASYIKEQILIRLDEEEIKRLLAKCFDIEAAGLWCLQGFSPAAELRVLGRRVGQLPPPTAAVVKHLRQLVQPFFTETADIHSPHQIPNSVFTFFQKEKNIF